MDDGDYSFSCLRGSAAGGVCERRGSPLRKAGRWEQKTTMDEGGKKHEQMLTICIDADMERNTAAASDAERR